jgi:hypothetical protein
VMATNIAWKYVDGVKVTDEIGTPQEMEECTSSDFERTADNLNSFKQATEIGIRLLCTPKRDDITIKNFYHMPTGRLLRLGVEKCDRNKHSGCEEN